MSDSEAKKRAAARREAILNSRGNRLAKLTSSARGEEAGLYDESPQNSVRASPTPSFLGEDSPSIPRPASATSNRSGVRQPAPGPTQGSDTLSHFSPEQENMMRALFSGMAGGSPAGLPQLGAPLGGLPSIVPGMTPPGINTPTGQPTDPFAAIIAQMTGQAPGVGPSSTAFGGMPAMPPMTEVPKPKTTFMKLAPLLHAFSVLSLIAFFVVRYEPNAYFGVLQPTWDRWASLAKGQGNVAFVPIFWAFTSLQVVLHSIRYYNEPPPSQPSGMIGMVVSNLPHPYPGIINAARRYFGMGSAVMDDIAVMVFGIGCVVWAAGIAVPNPGGVV